MQNHTGNYVIMCNLLNANHILNIHIPYLHSSSFFLIRIFRKRRESKARTKVKAHSTQDTKEKNIISMLDRQIPAAIDKTTREICTDLKCEVHNKRFIRT